MTILYKAIPGLLGDAEELEDIYRDRPLGSDSPEMSRDLRLRVLERYHPERYRITYAGIMAIKWRNQNKCRIVPGSA